MKALKVEEPVQEKRGKPNQTTGLVGVCKNGKKYKAQINYGGTKHNLGSFDTKEQAGIAYDRFVVDKSTEEVSFTLNYPNMSDHARDVALPVELVQVPVPVLVPHKKRRSGTEEASERREV